MPIFDQGYQHWSGQLSGHAWRWLAITRHGIRVGMQNRLLRLVLLFAMLPASALAGVVCFWGLLEQKSALVAPLLPMLNFVNPQILSNPREFRAEIWTLSYHYFLLVELFFSMILILLVGPNLISRDLRYNALPLYLSRPLRRFDYFLGKLGVVVFFLGMVTVVPVIVAYVLGLLFSLDSTIIDDTFGLLVASVAYGLIIAVSAGTFILALSSLTRNSRYVAMLWIGIWFIGTSVSGLLNSIDDRHYRRVEMQYGMHVTEDVARAAEEAERKNWRYLVSYTANLSRIEQQLLDTDAAWKHLTDLLPHGSRERMLMQRRGPQYPWQWSAGVLAVLFGLSLCVLNLSVKSLDRLK